MLRRAGFTVREVTDGIPAVGAATKRPPDLAVLDVKMPGSTASRPAAAEVPRAHAPHPGADALGDVPRDRGAGRGPRDRRRRLPHPARRGPGAGGHRPLAAARAQPRGRGAARRLGVADDFEAIRTRLPCSTRRRGRARQPGVPGHLRGRRGGTRVDALEEAASSGELRLASSGSTACASTRLERLERRSARRDAERRHRGAPIDATRGASPERSISRTLQQTLLPARLPGDPRLALDAWHVAAERELIVGGDWYDVIETAHGLWLVMGDVAGHGVAATAQAGQLRHSLRVYAHEGFGPAESVLAAERAVRATSRPHGDDVHRRGRRRSGLGGHGVRGPSAAVAAARRTVRPRWPTATPASCSA